jgi:hypothetical protein
LKGDEVAIPYYSAFVKLFFLELLIPADGTWESGLSRALDAALADLEGAW